MSFDFSAAQVRDYSDEARARRAYGRGTIIIYALWGINNLMNLIFLQLKKIIFNNELYF